MGLGILMAEANFIARTWRVRVPGTTAYPTAGRVIQAMKSAGYLIRDRDGKFPAEPFSS